MGQINQLLARLTLRQKILLATTAIALIAGIVLFTRWQRERDFKPLYTQLAPEDASAVVQKLKESGSQYRLTDGGATVLVPSERAAELRIQLAGAGLPRTGRVGFELFDKTNFGVTDFAEHINYRRALEGELERSVMALSEVESARVHITFPKDSVFLEQRQPAKASVMVKLRTGVHIAPGNVTAISHLIASAVEGLDPDAVSIVDMQGRLLSRPRRTQLDSNAPSEAMLDFKQQVEKDLLTKVNSTLEPLLGPDKFRAGVSVECDFTSGEQSEEVFDPNRSVMTTSQKTEDLSGANLASGVPGTASSLPRPASRPGTSGTGVSRRTENVSYQTSRVVKHTRMPQGTLRRMSLAVLVDHTVRWNGKKRIVEPPPPERLKTIRDLVAAATGLNTERGDQLTVESLPFESTLNVDQQGPPAAPVSAPAAPTIFALPIPLDQKTLMIAGAGAGLVILLLMAFLLFRRRGKGSASVESGRSVAGGKGAPALTEGDGPSIEEQLEARLAEQAALKKKMEADVLNQIQLPPVTTKKGEVLQKHLSESAKKDPIGAAHVVRTWLYDLDQR